MTKQEIQKAIDNGESVWYAHDYTHDTEIEQIRPSKNIAFQKNFFYFNIFNGCYNSCFYYERTFKTKAEAEHYLHHANITRAEELLFLTWEEFKDGKEITFKGRNSNEYELSYNECLDMIELIGKKGMYWSILQSWKATEENFYKAYDECVRLFERE